MLISMLWKLSYQLFFRDAAMQMVTVTANASDEMQLSYTIKIEPPFARFGRLKHGVSLFIDCKSL